MTRINQKVKAFDKFTPEDGVLMQRSQKINENLIKFLKRWKYNFFYDTKELLELPRGSLYQMFKGAHYYSSKALNGYKAYI
ncbi:MAG: hypothetical protein K8R86_13145 [Bacteroidales bacterium]|nr:hypothetical protein [Bacteroidales bacterium]